MQVAAKMFPGFSGTFRRDAPSMVEDDFRRHAQEHGSEKRVPAFGKNHAQAMR
jgi:hypothetical protein